FGYALTPDTEPALFLAARVGTVERNTVGDVRDAAAVDAAFALHSPQIVIHMAAQPLVRVAYEQPRETYSTNVAGTAVVLDAARRCDSVRAVVVVTSDKCYDLRGVDRARAEDDALGGAEPYAASKAGAELVTAALRSSLFAAQTLIRPCGLATARAGNTLGGGDWARDRLMPDLIASFIEGVAAPVRNPGAVRPWQHILDALRGYFVLAQRLWHEPAAFSEAWNFGPPASHERPVRWVADEASRLFERGARWRTDETRHPAEASALRLDSSKALRRLEWTAHLDLTQAIEWTVGWYRAYYDGASARALVEADLERYGALVPA
ncbi:MAG: CDP-glucose 4,6-dehydratase, partial [Candidatus Eremiobacteraeota bacterium]|nr:CDP-glucose 4,6-dehydratase [Candidatus Eremiobacteraeota bacterium]